MPPFNIPDFAQELQIGHAISTDSTIVPNSMLNQSGVGSVETAGLPVMSYGTRHITERQPIRATESRQHTSPALTIGRQPRGVEANTFQGSKHGQIEKFFATIPTASIPNQAQVSSEKTI
jgi:hypothetical protein